MKLICSIFSAKKLTVFILCLFASTNSTWAEHHDHQHLATPTFSDPDILNEVSTDWKNKPFKHNDIHLDADLVVALGQQSYPIFKDLINEYAKKLSIFIQLIPSITELESDTKD